MILYITGPSGAGKSTLARAWVASQKRDIALIDGDHITSWIRRGEKSAVNMAFAEGLDKQIDEQYRISAQVCAAAVRVYDENGVDVVIAQLCSFDPPPPTSKGWDLLEPLGPVFIVLFPERDKCRERLIARGHPPDTNSYDFDWPAWKGHPRALFLDNSDLSVDESVVALNELLDQRVGSDGEWL